LRRVVVEECGTVWRKEGTVVSGFVGNVGFQKALRPIGGVFYPEGPQDRLLVNVGDPPWEGGGSDKWSGTKGPVEGRKQIDLFFWLGKIIFDPIFLGPLGPSTPTRSTGTWRGASRTTSRTPIPGACLSVTSKGGTLSLSVASGRAAPMEPHRSGDKRRVMFQPRGIIMQRE